MAYLCKLCAVFCLLLTFMVSCSESNKDTKIAFPIFDVSKLCAGRTVFGRSRKIICLFCKGFDPTCFKSSTTTTTTTTTTSTTTTAVPTTTNSTTTTTTTKPTTKATNTEVTPATE